MEKLKKTKELLFYIYPLAFIVGPAVIEILSILISLIFFIITLKNKDLKYFKNKFFYFFIFWNLYLIFTSFISDNIYLSLESSLFYFRFIILSLALWHTLENSKNFLKFFCISLLIVFIFVQVDSYVQYFYGKNFLGFEFDRFSQARLSGVFNTEWILGSYISRLLPLLLALLILSYSVSLKLKIVSMILLISSDILIFLSAERTAFFYLILTTLMMLIFLNSFKILRIFCLILSMTLIVIISLSSDVSKKRIIDKTFDDLITDSGKLAIFSVQHQVIYETSIKIFNDNKFFGIGPKNFREICKLDKYKSFTDEDGSVDGCQTHPHNTYVQLLTETGLVGIFPIIFIFFYVSFIFFKQFYFLYFKNKYYMKDGLILLYIAVFITIWPFVTTGNFFNNYINFIYFLPVGFIIYEESKEIKKIS